MHIKLILVFTTLIEEQVFFRFLKNDTADFKLKKLTSMQTFLFVRIWHLSAAHRFLQFKELNRLID